MEEEKERIEDEKWKEEKEDVEDTREEQVNEKEMKSNSYRNGRKEALFGSWCRGHFLIS